MLFLFIFLFHLYTLFFSLIYDLEQTLLKIIKFLLLTSHNFVHLISD